MRSLVKKTGVVFYIVLVAALLFMTAANLYFALTKYIWPEKQMTIFGFSYAVVISGSMEPAVSVYDVVINRRQESYSEGDVITFQAGDSMVTHRVVSVSGREMSTKGDSNNAVDVEKVSVDHVWGKVICTIPEAGKAVAFFRSPLGMTVLFLTGVIIIEAPRFFGSRKRSRQK